MSMHTLAHVAGAVPPLLLPLMPPEDDPVVVPEDDPDPPELLPEPDPEPDPEPELDPLELPPGPIGLSVLPPQAAKERPRNREARTVRRWGDRGMVVRPPYNPRASSATPEKAGDSRLSLGQPVRDRGGVVAGARDPPFTTTARALSTCASTARR
jgi:hypothetical protein